MKLTLQILLDYENSGASHNEMLIALCAQKLFLCIGFSFSGCYSSQQLSQNNILLTTIKFKTFQDYFVKFKDFKALNLVQYLKSRLFKTFKAIHEWTLYNFNFSVIS